MRPKLLLLVRHAESEKNVVPSFSRQDGAEAVTEEGRRQCRGLASVLRPLLARFDDGTGACLAAHAAATVRSVTTAELLAKQLGCVLERHEGLLPISAGSLAGLTENVAQAEAPEFSRALNLYRAGVLSSYQIPGYGESVKDFEERVGRTVEDEPQEKARQADGEQVDGDADDDLVGAVPDAAQPIQQRRHDLNCKR